MRGSSCLSEPAAALRGFAKLLLARRRALGVELVETVAGHDRLRPRTSSTAAAIARAGKVSSGTERIVFRLEVMSSPVMPSPRVAPT